MRGSSWHHVTDDTRLEEGRSPSPATTNSPPHRSTYLASGLASWQLVISTLSGVISHTVVLKKNSVTDNGVELTMSNPPKHSNDRPGTDSPRVFTKIHWNHHRCTGGAIEGHFGGLIGYISLPSPSLSARKPTTHWHQTRQLRLTSPTVMATCVPPSLRSGPTHGTRAHALPFWLSYPFYLLPIHFPGQFGYKNHEIRLRS